MSDTGLGVSLKRRRPEGNAAAAVRSLTEQERIIYNAIHSKQNMGIWMRDIKQESKLPDHVVNKSLKLLQSKNVIKEIVNIQNKGRKHYIAAEFEPSKEITGGTWYEGGNLDTDLIVIVKDFCIKQITKLNVATLDKIADSIRKSGIMNIELTKQQIEDILRALILDNEITEIKSTGTDEFALIPTGRACYKLIPQGRGGEPRDGALVSVPCGVCPRLTHCTPGGVISPSTCSYYTKWLSFF